MLNHIDNLQEYNVLGTPFREHQEEYIEAMVNFALDPNKKYMIFQGNVGIGKSLVAITASKYLSKNYKKSIYLTSPKNILLDQYQHDYDKFLAVIKGSTNYPCVFLHGNCTYDQGPCHKSKKKQCPLVDVCPYKVAISQAKTDPIVLTNMHWLLCSMGHEEIAPTRDLLIIDEAHSLESILIDFLTISYSGAILENLTNITKRVLEASQNLYKRVKTEYKGPEQLLDKTFLKEIPTATIDEINIILDSLDLNIIKLQKAFEKGIEQIDVTQLKKEKELKEWVSLNKDLTFLLNLHRKIGWYKKLENEANWLCIPAYKENSKQVCGFTIKPLNAVALAKILLPKVADKVVFMSATIGKKEQFCKDLGVNPVETTYIETESDFPKDKRPVYLDYVGYFNKQTQDEYLRNAVKEIDKLLEKYPNYNGVIHTTTFAQCEYIQKNSKYAHRILTHTTKTKTEVVNYFMESPGKVLCSPSSKEGLDLKDDLCRFQIILKVPWGDLADKVVQARMKEDPVWYANEAVKNLEQAYGRGMRSKTDWCDCYILDQSFQRLLFQNYDLLSKYFREAIII